MITSHILYFLFWAIYFALHSFLATTRIKKALYFIRPTLYRFLYSFFASITLLALLIYGASLESILVILPGPISSLTGLIIAGFGVFILKRAFRNYSFRAFMGLKKESNTSLKTDGIHSIIRHPLYTGTLLIALGYFFFNPLLINAITFLSIVLYLPIGIHWEEKKLIETYGEDYIEYKKEVPALFPRLKKIK